MTNTEDSAAVQALHEAAARLLWACDTFTQVLDGLAEPAPAGPTPPGWENVWPLLHAMVRRHHADLVATVRRAVGDARRGAQGVALLVDQLAAATARAAASGEEATP
jgi:hypothetical protein